MQRQIYCVIDHMECFQDLEIRTITIENRSHASLNPQIKVMSQCACIN